MTGADSEGSATETTDCKQHCMPRAARGVWSQREGYGDM